MTTYGDRVQVKLSGNQAQDLRRVLAECRYMKTMEGRQQVMSDLQKDYPEIASDSHADTQIAIAKILDICFEFGGAACFETFLGCLESYEGGGSDKMKAVWTVWQGIVGPPPVPGQLRGEPLGEEGSVRLTARIRVPRKDRLARAGGEFHWNRDLWVEEFLDIVSAKPGKEDIRVLAVPAPPEADPDRFAQYLEAQCDDLSRSTDVEPRIVTVRLPLTDPLLLPYQVVVRILSLLAGRSEMCRESLRDAGEQISREWGPREARAQLSLSSLAEKFTGYVRELARSCRPVILIHGFNEKVDEELRSWLLYTWLESYQYDLRGAVVMLAGSPRLGLEALSRPPHMVCFDPLPQLDSHDLWEWAYYGHRLTWITLEFVTMCNKKFIHGSALTFYTWIESWKAFAQVAPEDKLIELLSASLPG